MAKKGKPVVEKTTATEDTTAAPEEVLEAPPEEAAEKTSEDPSEGASVTTMTAMQFIDTFEKNINGLTEAVWKSVVDANQGGVFVNRNIASAAFSEVMLRICVAQAKSVEGGVERFKEILDL
jgi:hypothetical protein